MITLSWWGALTAFVFGLCMGSGWYIATRILSKIF